MEKTIYYRQGIVCSNYKLSVYIYNCNNNVYAIFGVWKCNKNEETEEGISVFKELTRICKSNELHKLFKEYVCKGELISNAEIRLKIENNKNKIDEIIELATKIFEKRHSFFVRKDNKLFLLELSEEDAKKIELAKEIIRKHEYPYDGGTKFADFYFSDDNTVTIQHYHELWWSDPTPEWGEERYKPVTVRLNLNIKTGELFLDYLGDDKEEIWSEYEEEVKTIYFTEDKERTKKELSEINKKLEKLKLNDFRLIKLQQNLCDLIFGDLQQDSQQERTETPLQ